MNKLSVGTAGGIEAVLKAINEHINDVHVCEHGCSALYMIVDGSKKC